MAKMTEDENEPGFRDAAIDWLMRCNDGRLIVLYP
jgi:hypothetical protein